MRPGKSGKAFALAYTLLVSAVIMLFAGALFSRATESMRVSGLDVTSVHATALADTGAQLAYSLLRDHDPQYFKTRNPLRSADLGPEFARNVIGGSFEVQVDDADYTATGLYPNNGTFYTIISTGRVGNHVARTEMILKMTNPLLNYLFLAPEDLRLKASRTVVGPIVVNADPASGDRGNLSFGHDEDYWSSLSHQYEHDGGDLRLDIQARATGDIYIRNSSDHGYTQAPLQLNGRYAPQSFQHQDHVILAAGGSWDGHVVLTDDCALEANAKFTTKIPTMDKLLKRYRDGTGPSPVDISGEAGGVLVEFTGSQVFISQAVTRQVGRVYDRAHALEQATYLIDSLYRRYYGISQAAAQVMLDQEVDWNDPVFPDRPYPADLGPGTGDYIDVYRIERGATLQSYALSDASWTTIYLTTSRTDYLTADGRRQGPPVLVRGMVDGKCMVVYDVTDDSLDPGANRLHMILLGQHEDPADSPGNKLPTGGAPGVVGGLLYADRNIKADPDQATFTNDRVLLMCRGSITGGGEPAVHRGRMHDMADAPYDYESVLRNLDQSYSQFYTGTSNARDFRVSSTSATYWSDGPYSHFYGIAVSAHSDRDDWRLNSLGQVVDRPSNDYPTGGIATWDDFGFVPPAGANPNSMAIFPWGFRHVRAPGSFKGDVRGSFHSVQTSYEISGNAYYDYSWQALKEQEIRQELFLPVQPVMSSFQRL